MSFCSIFARRFQSFSTSYLLNYLIYCFLSTLCNVLKSSFVTPDKTSASGKLLDQFPGLQGHFRWLYISKIGTRVKYNSKFLIRYSSKIGTSWLISSKIGIRSTKSRTILSHTSYFSMKLQLFCKNVWCVYTYCLTLHYQTKTKNTTTTNTQVPEGQYKS